MTLNKFALALFIFLPFGYILFIFWQISLSLRSKETLRSTNEYCDAAKELRNWTDSNPDGDKETYKLLRDREEQTFQKFLKAHNW